MQRRGTLLTLCALLSFPVLLLVPIGLCADAYVKGAVHVDSGFRYGHHVPEQNVTYEWWVARQQATFVCTGWSCEFCTSDWRLTIDRERGQIIGVNLTEKVYFETRLAASPLSIMDSSAAERLKLYQIDGTVEQTGGKETVQGRHCEVLRVAEWLLRNGDRDNDRDRTLRLTRDVPFDAQLACAWEQWVRALFSPAPRYLDELQKVKGFVMAEDATLYANGNQLTWSFRVVEISTKNPPEGIYAAPPGFQKKNIGPAELRGLRDILYPGPIY